MIKNLMYTALLAVGLISTSSYADLISPSCNGKMFNPVTDTDWNNIFPITVAGISMTGSSGNTDSPLMKAMPPICSCPSILGIPMVGIGITYWQPQYISEIERRPGCLSSLGGTSVLPGYSLLASEQSNNDDTTGGGSVNRMQVHWYQYPAFAMLDIIKSISCTNPSGFNLMYMTEIDPLWQDDLWGSIFSPETLLFSNPVAVAACAVDAVSSSLAYPMDSLFWCAGSWGTVYPLTGNSQHGGTPFTLNNQVQAKFIARSHRMGLMWQTIGPTAICSSHINPVWVKSQYRFNQVAPVARRGKAVATGSLGLYQYPPVSNYPTQEHTVNLIWQGQQCCLKGIP